MKARVRIVAEPTGQPRKFCVGRVTLVQVGAGGRTGAGIQIFVRTPDGEVDLPIVQRQRHIAGRVGKIDSDGDSMLLCRLCDCRNVEELSGEKIHAGDHHYRELISVLLDKIDNILGPHGEFAFARTGENECIFRVESVMHDLCFDRVGVGRKRRVFH